MKNTTKKFEYSVEVVPIPTVSRRRENSLKYADVLDKLMMLQSYEALKLNYKEFVKKETSFLSGLRQAAKKRKMDVSISYNPETEATVIWRRVLS